MYRYRKMFTLTDFCIICGVLCMLSCVLFPRVVYPSAANAVKVSYRESRALPDPYQTSVITVRVPSPGQDGRINLVAYNRSTRPALGLLVRYETADPIVVDHVVGAVDGVTIVTTRTSVEARFRDLPADRWAGVAVDYHPVDIGGTMRERRSSL